MSIWLKSFSKGRSHSRVCPPLSANVWNETCRKGSLSLRTIAPAMDGCRLSRPSNRWATNFVKESLTALPSKRATPKGLHHTLNYQACLVFSFLLFFFCPQSLVTTRSHWDRWWHDLMTSWPGQHVDTGHTFWSFFLSLTSQAERTCDRGETAVSYKCTGWVWEITGWRSRLQENFGSF